MIKFFTNIFTNYIPVFNITFGFDLLDSVFYTLYSLKISHYVKDTARTQFTSSITLDAFRLLVIHKMFKNRIDSQEMEILDEMLSKAQIPLWANKILECVPTLPKNPFDPITVFNVPFTLDKNFSHTTGNGWAVQYMTTAQLQNMSNCIRYFRDTNIYTGPLVAYNSSTSDYSLLELIFSPIIPSGTQAHEPLQNLWGRPRTADPSRIVDRSGQDNTTSGFILGSTFNFKIVTGKDYSEMAFLAIMMISPNFNTWSFSTYVNTLAILISEMNVTVDVNNSLYVLFKDHYFVNFPNPSSPPKKEKEQPDPAPAGSNGEEPSKQGGDGSKGTPKGKLPDIKNNKIKIDIVKVRSKSERKVKFVEIKLDLSKLIPKLNESAATDISNKIATSLVAIESAANQMQVDSGYLLNIISKSWTSAKDRIET